MSAWSGEIDSGDNDLPSSRRLQLDTVRFRRFLAVLIRDWCSGKVEKLIKIGAKVVTHGRYVAFQMADVAGIDQLLAAHARA